MSFSWFGLALAHGSKCGFGTGVMYLHFCVSVFPTFAQVWMCQGFGGHWPMVAEAVTGSRGSHRPGPLSSYTFRSRPLPAMRYEYLPTFTNIFFRLDKYTLQLEQICFYQWFTGQALLHLHW